MYSIALLGHSWLRWVVVATGFLVVGRAMVGSARPLPWTTADNRAIRWFTMTLDLQFLLGLLLYFWLSPITGAALRDLGEAVRNESLRFWAVEHPVGMLAGVVFAHIGRVRVSKAQGDRRRHRLGAVFFTIALILTVLSIPWPGRAFGRPLVRW
jgi:hypothetical protein